MDYMIMSQYSCYQYFQIIIQLYFLEVQLHQQTPTQYGLWHLEQVEAEMVTGGEEEIMGGNWLGLSGGAVWEMNCVCWFVEGMWGEAGATEGVIAFGMGRDNCGEPEK